MDILVHHTDSAEVTMCLIINFPFSPKKHKVNFIFKKIQGISPWYIFKSILHAKS